MTSPSRPSVARKANASGTPAKFEATPENVITGPRSQCGSPPNVTAQATAKPMMQPSSAEAKLMRIEIQKEPTIAGVNRLAIFSSVSAPSALWKAPSTIRIVGRIRNRNANAMNGTMPSQAQDRAAFAVEPVVSAMDRIRCRDAAARGRRRWPKVR